MTADRTGGGTALAPRAANRSTLLRLPLYVLASAVALVVPRDRLLWVFGRKAGVGEAPLAVLEVARRTGGERLVWLAQDETQLADARRRGLEAHLVRSWRGWWLTLRAGVLVLSYGLADVARPCAPGAHVVQTWHGSPLKRIHLDEPGRSDVGDGLLGRLSSRAMFHAVRLSGLLIGTMPAGSELVAERFRSAWRWRDDSRIAVVGDPRCDRLATSTAATRERARQALAAMWGTDSLPAHLVLWAPTWRDGGDGPVLGAADLTPELLGDLEEADAWLVLRAHPLGRAVGADDPSAVCDRIRYAAPADVQDLTAVLDAFDVLVTDYSAVAIDYSLLGRPQVFHAPDRAAYLRTRGLYEDYDLFTGGHVHDTWAATVAEVRRVLVDEQARRANVEATSGQIAERYHAFRDGRAAERLVDTVRRRTRAGGRRAGFSRRAAGRARGRRGR